MIFEGSFVKGLKEGKGTWRKNKDDPNSNRYEGEYKGDKKDGKGKFIWQSGGCYEGEYS